MLQNKYGYGEEILAKKLIICVSRKDGLEKFIHILNI